MCECINKNGGKHYEYCDYQSNVGRYPFVCQYVFALEELMSTHPFTKEGCTRFSSISPAHKLNYKTEPI